MYLHWLETATLGVVFLWFVMTTSKPDSNHNVIQPVGPKMCANQCRMGCSGYQYTPLFLSCRLIIKKTSSDQQSLEGTYYHKICKIYQAKRNLTCLRNSKIFYTRRNIAKCRRRQLKPNRQMKFTRLLMLPYSKKSHQGRQLYLRNKTVDPYPYIQSVYVFAVAYISSTRKLVISCCNLLCLMTLDDTDRTIITQGTRFTGITVDEEQQLVFLASSFDNTMQVMTTEGKDLKLLTTLPAQAGQIAADSQRQVVYVVVQSRHIARYTYKGQLEEVLVKGCIRYPVYFNSKRNILYYLVGRKKMNIVKMFLSNGTIFTIPSLVGPYPLSFYVYSNTLYFLPRRHTNRGNLYVLSDSGKHITTIKTGLDISVTDIAFCAIP